ncbi:MAG: response regulator [bacterium]|nr:response regulator [bacterium]
MGENKERHILFVDDDGHLAKMMTFLFMANGFNLETAKNGLDALEVLKRIKPEAIILDVMMPLMNGFECLKQIKENKALKDIPVIVLSALPSVDNQKKALSLGAYDYIVKPFRSSELIKKTMEAIRAASFD